MTYRELLKKAASELSDSGNEAPMTEARELMYHFLGADRMFLLDRAEDIVPEEKENELMRAVGKRKTGFPLQYILGSWSFMGTELSVGEGVLIPRDDTEVCVRECMKLLDSRGIAAPEILELCSGTGAISLALAKKYPKARITALELSDKAFGYLCRNIRDNNAEEIVKPVRADIFTAYESFPDHGYDVLISNPPYICTDEISTLQREVGFEPQMALDGGSDGLDFYRCISEKWLKKLRHGGIISLETGEQQGQAVSRLLSQCGAENVRVIKDISGLDRTVTGVV